MQCSLRKLQGQCVFSWDAVGVIKVQWCCGVGPCPVEKRSLLLLFPLQKEGSSEHPGKPQALLWEPFLDAAVVMSSRLYQRGLWSSLASSRHFILLTCHGALKLLLAIILSTGTQPLLVASHELLSGNLVWYKLWFFLT